MSKDSRNSCGAYLPERYKHQIEAKKRRRLLKKVAAITAVIAVAALVYGFLTGSLISPLSRDLQTLPTPADLSPEMSLSPAPAPLLTLLNVDTTAADTPPLDTGTDNPAGSVSGMISLDNAMTLLRRDYPEVAYNLVSANLTNQFGNSTFYQFWIHRSESSPADPGFPVFIDAYTGDPYTPGQENAGISAGWAKNLVREVFSIPASDRIRVRYDTDPDSIPAWIFDVYRDNTTIISGSLDTNTGQIASFSRSVSRAGRPADPTLDMSMAQKIADRYIVERNGAPLPVNMSEQRYESFGFGEAGAGYYVFTYTRIVQNIPCDYDGFTISVDSVTGEITEYNRRWYSPDNAFSVAVDSPVKKYEAIYSIQQRAQEIFPDSSTGLRIISAEIRWKDRHPSGVIPRPGSISAAWKVQFDDDTIRSQGWLSPATAWVDGRTGKVLEMDYRH